ncbi:hypothetical protein ACTOWA_02755 [Herbaspirillum seropedicae]|uniref:hypothetical protein n=1 Tax=Herbaspirillum seropedicae TaxID=964 RepID=UPI003F8D5773
MKKILFSVLIAGISVAPPISSAKEIAFNSYRILSDGPFIEPKISATVTYVITNNPPMALIIFPGGPATIKRIGTGQLTGCDLLDSERVERLRQGGVKMAPLVSQLHMAIQMGKVPTNEERKFYDSVRNFVTFVNEADDAPYYQCDKK